MGFDKLKNAVSRVPVVRGALRRPWWRLRENQNSAKEAFSSTEYWEKRYASGGNSGVGSYNQFAQLKADVINRVVSERDITSVIEFGCGDGNQASLITCGHYLGFDVSETAVRTRRPKLPDDSTREFKLVREYSGARAQLTLSLDVIYHLVEDQVFEHCMRRHFPPRASAWSSIRATTKTTAVEMVAMCDIAAFRPGPLSAVPVGN